MLKKLYFLSRNFVFDLLFPRTCLGCGVEGQWICGECLKTIDIIKQPFCPECRRPSEAGEFCHFCRGGVSPPALDGIFICANFGEGVLKEVIHHFKYNYIFDIGNILGKMMAGKLRQENKKAKKQENTKIPRCDQWEYPQVGPPDFPEFDLVISVPLHKKRLRQRGFNQAEILAREIIKMYRSTLRFKAGALNQHILVRKKYTTPQAELDREQRLNNLKDVFVFVGNNANIRNSHGCSLRGKNILLVDDITTTGTTLEECAKVLKLNGARSVWGIVLAKGK
ncbi:MAG: ComF family protein [Patescibacteria group bacterium]|nr:ComF family protein [Patescibacteria group bacterium]